MRTSLCRGERRRDRLQAVYTEAVASIGLSSLRDLHSMARGAAHVAHDDKLRRLQRPRHRLDMLQRVELAVLERRRFEVDELPRRHEHTRLERADRSVVRADGFLELVADVAP